MTMRMIIEKCERRRRHKGVSMVSLVITIIVMIVLAAIVFVSSNKTIDEADYSKYVSNLSDVSVAFYEASTAVNGEKVAESNEKKVEQVYNYVAKAGTEEKDFLPQSDIPSYTILKDERQIGINLPEMKVESGTGKRVSVTYATTKSGKIFTWPPYEHGEKYYITDLDTVEHKMQTEIVVGGEKLTIEIDPVYGTLVGSPTGDDEEEQPGGNTPIEHKYTVKVQSAKYLCSSATCTKPAIYYYKCETCDEKGATTYVAGEALGHSFGEYTVRTPATCAEKGEKNRTCATCHVEEKAEIEINPNNHIKGENEVIKVAASCTEKGTKAFNCKGCGKELRTEEIAALGHSFGEYTVRTPANCTEKGEKYRTCATCQIEEKAEIEINPNNHTKGENEVIKVDASCTEKGTKAFNCKGCGKELRTEEIAATGHSFGEYTVRTPANCTEKGEKYRTCATCHVEEKAEIEINPNNHHGGEEETIIQSPSCTTKGEKAYKCESCKKILRTVEISATGHEYLEVVISATCTEAGCTLHKCDVCGDEYKDNNVEALGHVDSNNDGNCDRCGEHLVVYELSGKWIFNEGPASGGRITLPSSTIQQYVNYSYGISYTGYTGNGFYVTSNGISFNGDSEEKYPQYTSVLGWDMSYCNYIDFGEKSQTVSKEFYEWFTVNATQTSAEEPDTNKIPKGGIYYVGVTNVKLGSYTGATEIYYEGEQFPTTTRDGDVYVYGDYEYRYNYYYFYSTNGGYPSEWRANSNTKYVNAKYVSNGWGVRVRQNKSEYEEMFDYINNEPVRNLVCTFQSSTVRVAPTIPDTITCMVDTFYNSSLTTAPVIPYGVKYLKGTFTLCDTLKTYKGNTSQDGDFTNYIIPSSVTDISSLFYGCESIVKAPDLKTATNVTEMTQLFYGCKKLESVTMIPAKVQDLTGVFSGCSSLIKVPVIPSTVTKMARTFQNCTSLSGEIKINANPTSYSQCFSGTTNPIVLTGTSTKLDVLAQTSKNGNVKVG